MVIETIDIHWKQKNLARYDSKVVDKCTNKNLSKSEGQDMDPAEAEVVNVTGDLMQSIGNVQFDFRSPTVYIQRVTSSHDPQLTVENS